MWKLNEIYRRLIVQNTQHKILSISYRGTSQEFFNLCFNYFKFLIKQRKPTSKLIKFNKIVPVKEHIFFEQKNRQVIQTLNKAKQTRI